MEPSAEVVRRGMQAHQQGDFATAEACYREVLREQPEHGEAALFMGVLCCQRRDNAEGCRWFAQAARGGVDNPLLNINYGMALLETGAPGDALPYLEKGAAQDRNSPEVRFNLARCLLALGRYREAKVEFEQLLALTTHDGAALSNYGLTLVRCGLPQEGLQALKSAFGLLGETPNLRRHVGEAWERLKNYTEAQANYRRAFELAPEGCEALLGIARVSALSGDFTAARESCARAGTNFPENPAVLVTTAAVNMLAGDLAAGEEAARSALLLEENNGEACGLLAYALAKRGDTAEADRYYVKAHEFCPQSPVHYLNHANNLIAQGRVEEALDCSQACLALEPSNTGAFSNILLHLHYPSGIGNDEILSLHRKWGQLFAEPVQFSPSAPEPFPQRPRIGFLSGDLRRHSVAFFCEPLLRHLPELGCECFIYSNNPFEDEITARLRGYGASWRDIRLLNDEQAAELIAADGLDLLCDLSGHTDHNRLVLLARAPVSRKLTWLGYPDTTGITGIMRLVDGITDPVGEDGSCTEKLLRMPECFLCFLPPENAPEPAAPESDGITFGSFNALAKISDETLRLWAGVLEAVPQSRLLLKSRGLDDPQARELLLARAERAGIVQERLDLLASVPDLHEHLRTYNRVDIALDTTPYNGTTTTCEALWMGCPVVTLRGQRHSARVGASLLSACGLGELIAAGGEEYIRLAADLAADRAQLAGARSGRREQLRNGPLLDTRSFARDFLRVIAGA